MPVLSPRHSSSLSGTYRSSYSTSLSRPYYSSSNYSPRITTSSYSERFSTSTKSYDDGKRIYSRHASIADDGVTSRYREREEIREKSSRRDSLNRDSAGRDSSLTRGGGVSSTTMSVIETVADFRNKYSPANYVPSVLRKSDNISRSRSINDIGRPPVETKSLNSKKVITSMNNSVASSTNLINTTNCNKMDNNGQLNDDTNGNKTSVAEIRKKFDPNYKKPQGNSLRVHTHSEPIRSKLQTDKNNKINPANTNETSQKKGLKKQEPHTELLGGNKFFTRTPKYLKMTTLGIQDGSESPKGSQEPEEELLEENKKQDSIPESPESGKNHNHTSNFASYIPTKDFYEEQNNSDLIPEEDSLEKSENLNNKLTTSNNDITTSPRLNRTSINQQNSTSAPSTNNATSHATNNRSSPTVDRDRTRDDSEPRSYENRSADQRNLSNSSPARTQGLNGLKNIGNTCFMNSVIQCLSNTRYLLEYVREEGYMEDINTSISSMKGALIKAFSQVIQELWSADCSDKVVNTVALKSQIQRFAPRFMGYAQQDAQEFLRYLLEGLHEDVNRVVSKPKPILTEIEESWSDSQKASESWQRYLRMDNSRVVDIFVGQLKSTLRCTHCGHCSVTFDPFWDLSLPIPQRQGPLRLGQCLEYFTREETMDGDEKPTCSKCKERRKCTKSFSIQKFPKILVIHLKRFSPTERFRGKLSLVIDFPLQGLDLSAYSANKALTECVYNLYAISNHSGTTYSGHYTAYCKHPYSGQWHEYNDSRVTNISAKNVVSSEAYVLFYELVGQHSHL